MSRRAATFLLLIATALLGAHPAVAQERTPKPSAHELWQEYPLDQGGSPSTAPAPAASPAPARTSVPPRRSRGVTSSDDHATSIAVVLLLAAGAIALLGLGAVLLKRGRRTRATRARPIAPGPARPRAATSVLAEVPAAEERGTERQRPPPEPARPWVAEIEWRSAGAEARFCVVARDHPASGGTVLARSAPLDWPPTGPDSVAALSAAAERLAAALTHAGWSSLPAGDAWYAKRFGWDPTRPRAGRFRRVQTWLWRCEIEWSAGDGGSRFQAVMYEPGASSGQPISASPAFRSVEVDMPDPSATAHQAEVQALVTALEAAGWRRFGHGARWYAERFIWPDETPPPDRLELLAGGAEPTP